MFEEESPMSIDRLQQLIIEKKNPTVVGLDPRPAYIPPQILAEHIAAKGETLEAAADAFYAFNCGLIDALADELQCRGARQVGFARFADAVSASFDVVHAALAVGGTSI